MKNLANCTPREFLKQTSRIRKATENWLTITDLMSIRKDMPDLEEIPKNASAEDVERLTKENRRRLNEQSRKNAARMLDSIMDEHPDETLDLLALLCFIEPEDVDNHSVDEFLEAITEMISNQAVIGFFTSLAQLGLMDTSGASRV